MDLPSSTNQTPALCSTFDELEKHLRCLSALGEDINHRHFVSLLLSKLPKDVVIKLEEMKGPTEVWSVQLLWKNLQAHLTARENAERKRRTYLPQNVASKNKFTTSLKRSSAEALIAGASSNASYLQNQQRKKCACCQGNHWSDECHKYETIMQRKEKIKGKCYICFSPKQLLRACSSGRQCVYGKRRHNHYRSLCSGKFRDHDNEASVVITEERPVTSIEGTSMQSHENEAKTALDETTKQSVNAQAH